MNWSEEIALKKQKVWTIKDKAKAYLELIQRSLMELYWENSNQLSAIFIKKLHLRCFNGF